MSLTRAVCAAAVVVGGPGAAAAQATGDSRFFVDKLDDGREDETLWQGSLTSTSFVHREVAGATNVGAAVIENAAPSRLFTDLRAQLDARHIRGRAWDARLDARVRVANTLPDVPGGPAAPRPQSGSLSKDEYELRELYVVRGSVRTDLYVGRQTVLDVAAIKIDGVRLDYAKNARWTYLGFVGLYPQRGSRSITTDYPRRVDAMREPTGKRVTPVTGGVGGAYRTERTYGAIGVAGIAPLGDDLDTGTLESPRLLVTSNGYWRQSPQLDVYHYGVVDVIGAGGFALTNVSAGVNYRPQPRLHVGAALHRVDTETLNVQAQTALEDPDARDVGVIQNNVKVMRIASDSARTSLSAALGKTMRWELSVAGAVRRRPEIRLEADDPGLDQTIAGAQAGEVSFQAVDRRFYGGLRVVGSFARIFGIGTNAARSASSIYRVTASRELAGGRGEWEASVGYLASLDENRATCTTADLASCYGTAEVRTVSASATAFYRLKRDWFVMGTLEAARQRLTTLEGGVPVDNPAILGTTAFLRIAYRF
jgi:hypothetical protein